MPVPPPRPPTETFAQVPAVALFLQRAHAILPGFTLSPANAASVAAICHRLDGMPLAIELAAARIKLLNAQALLDRLDDRFRLPPDGAADPPFRQQTLSNNLLWRY